MTQITIHATINAPVDLVWNAYNNPNSITKWNFASDDWQCPWAKVDLRKNGSFSSRMEAKDGSFGFEFGGIYTEVISNEFIEYKMDDGRKACVKFDKHAHNTIVTITFDAETQNPIDMQRDGWQSILNNFKKHVESSK